MPQKQSQVINLDELQTILEKILKHIRLERGVTSVPLEANYYWNIQPDRMIDISSKINSAEIDVGSLFDDWDFVRQFVFIKDQPLAVHLTMVAALLRYVGMTAENITAADGG